MNTPDLYIILGNLSKALDPIQRLIGGSAYLIGIVLLLVGIFKLKTLVASGKHGGQDNRMFIPVAYLLSGVALLYLPSAVTTLSATAFGVSNILQYTQYDPYNIYASVGFLIQTAGFIWFVRGCVMLAHASEPGVQEGPKGMAFLCAGVLAINFENSVSMMNYILSKMSDMTLKLAGLG